MSDYNSGYLYDIWQKSYPAEHGLKYSEIISWKILEYVYYFTSQSLSIQVLGAILQILSFGYLLRNLKLKQNWIYIFICILLMSNTYLLGVDWFVRQGMSWALFFVFVAIDLGPKGKINIFWILVLPLLAFTFHMSSLVYFICYIIAKFSTYLWLSENKKKRISLMGGLSLSLLLFISSYFLKDMMPDSPYSLYANTIWKGSSPRYLPYGKFIMISLCAYLTHFIFVSKKFSLDLTFFLFYLMSSSAVAGTTTYQAVRLLFVFNIIFALICILYFNENRSKFTWLYLLFLCSFVFLTTYRAITNV